MAPRPRHPRHLYVSAAFSILALLSGAAGAQRPLDAGFHNPPDSAKPHTWWHWMDGNVTREGITADLEAMKRVGIGGAQMFHVAQGIPPGPVGYNSPQWHAMVVHAVKEANRLGLELCIHNCAGWSSSGGPWITPEHAMQVLAWSTKRVSGPGRVDEALGQPRAPQVVRPVDFHRDICVLAFPTPTAPNAVEPVGQILGKTAVNRQDGIPIDTSPTPPGAAVPKEGVIDLTARMEPSGHLTWDAPAGDWTILRIGYTPTGKDNHPAPPEGDGLEVDKLSREALDSHWNGMMAKVIAELGPLAGKTLNNSLIDSYEVGSQNWTPKFREEFRKRRGYDLLPFLPAIAGYTIGSREVTSRFLWDFRRTIADLYADNYFGYFGDRCHKAGMKFSTEPYGNGLFDNIQAGGTADIPMGEFWIGGAAIETTKLASSIGHVYGRKFVGAESFTADVSRGRFIEEPYGIKALGDLVFCNGVNRYIFHRYAHQPWMNLYPGMTMGPWGTHLERTATWWNDASAWLQYVARCQFLLQEGRFVADALYFYGEGAPNDLPYRPGLRPQLPPGYDYDGCDSTVLLRLASVRDGRIVLPGGMAYRVLVLPEIRTMSPAMARKIRDLVAAGATVVGPKPQASPSLTGYPGCDTEVRQVADEVWGAGEATTSGNRVFGRGRVAWGRGLAEILDASGTPSDFEASTAGGAAARTAFIHRTIDGADVYFVSNQRYRPVTLNGSFRIAGRAPELWHPDTGRIESAPAYRVAKGRTTVPLRLDPAGSVFVVFRKPLPAHYLTEVSLRGERVTDPAAPKVTVLAARYETADGRGVDVKEKVAAMVAAGQMEIPATNEAYGDPVFMVVKRLRVTYEIDGKRYEKTVDENETMTLLEDSGGGSPESFELVGAPNGATLVPWTIGTFDVRTSTGAVRAVTVKSAPRSLDLAGPWQVRFPRGWGAPETARFDSLISWPASSDSGIRYFSGTATYVKEFSLPTQMVGPGRAVWLDLGQVKNFARVRLNGQDLGILWKSPYRVEVSGATRSGPNRLEVEVTNLWPNRLIGDEQLPPDVEWDGDHLKRWPDWLTQHRPRPATGRVAFTTWRFYTKESPLLESGLLGPVILRSTEVIPLP